MANYDQEKRSPNFLALDGELRILTESECDKIRLALKHKTLTKLTRTEDCSPFWTQDYIEPGDLYYLIDEEPWIDDDGVKKAFSYGEFATEDDDLKKLAYVKDARFGLIQFWREMLYRRLMWFKYQYDDKLHGEKVWLITANDMGFEFKLPNYGLRSQSINTGTGVTPVGVVYFTSSEMADKAIEEVVVPLLDECKLSDNEKLEVLRIGGMF